MNLKCRIAGLNVAVETSCKALCERAEKYSFNFRCEPDISVKLSRDAVKQYQNEHQEYSADDCDYFLTGVQFYSRLLAFDGFMLQGSAIEYDGKAYLFSAAIGAGKSTQTDYWYRYLGMDKINIINDGKPAVRLIDNIFYACGTPWSGKNGIDENIIVPIGAIAFIERSEKNYIRPIKQGELLKSFFPQTIRPHDPEHMSMLLDLFERTVAQVPVYVLGAENNLGAAEFVVKNILCK